MRCWSLLVAFLAAGGASAAIVAVAGGTGAPSPMLGPYTMTPFPDDPRPLWEKVTTVPSPLGGDVLFSEPLWHMEIGDGWKWWSHGYEGDVYFKYSSYILYLPPQTKAFYLYAGHDLDSAHYITVTAQDGTSVKQLASDVFAPAVYFGVYVDDPSGPDLKSLTVTTSPGVTLAVGEFGIGIPEPGALVMLSAGALLLGSRRR